MASDPNPFRGLTYEQLDILDDMFGEWLDKDRHGFLKSEWAYCDERIAAFSNLYKLHREAFE